jgi:diguanylate cyclase (GGDEF)-like protein/PAS domain S-box-containing protein
MDLTKLKNALISSEAIFHNSHDGIVCMGSDSKIVFANAAAAEMFGFDDISELTGEPVECLMSSDNAAVHHHYVDRHIAGESTPVMNSLRRIQAKKQSGELFPVDIHVFYFTVEGARYYAAFIRDMSEVARQEQALRDLAFADPLTGLPNVKSLEQTLRNIFSETLEKCHVISVIGIDRMRNINGSFGFEVGDEVIRTLANRFAAEFQSARFLGRLSGDQFVLVEEIASSDEVEGYLSILRNRLNELTSTPVTVKDARAKVEVTAGAIDIPNLADTPENAIKHAEMAYGDAKNSARARLLRLTRDRLQDIAYSAALTHQIRDAIQIGEFFIVVQPKIDVRSGRSNAGEVLVRWRRNDGEMISPGVFIPVAEDAGLIDAIGRFVFLEACALLRDTRNGTGALPKLAINVSPNQLLDPEFVRLAETTFDQLSVDPSLVELEITETAVASAPHRVLEALNRLRPMGISVALDDFGTGYSSLTMLRDMPIDKVKLDKSFIDEIDRSEKSFRLVENSIRMMKDLGFTVTVEGVEAREIHDMLFALGVDEAQGFFYSKPLPVDEFSTFDLSINSVQVDLFSKLKAEAVKGGTG